MFEKKKLKIFGLTYIVHIPQFKKMKIMVEIVEISADSALSSQHQGVSTGFQFSKMKFLAHKIRFLKRRIFYGKKNFMPD